MHYGIDSSNLNIRLKNKYENSRNYLKVAWLVSLEYKGSNVGILVGCYHAAIDLRDSI